MKKDKKNYKVTWSDAQSPWILTTEAKTLEFISGLLGEGVSPITVELTEEECK